MLFNSYVFLFAFLPITFALFYVLGGKGKTQLAMAWLTLASLYFYAWNNPIYLFLLIPSMLVNYGVGEWLSQANWAQGTRKSLCVATVAGNLLLLGFYKYAGFCAENINSLLHTALPVTKRELPLAISFFTFLQIAYVVDMYKGTKVERGFVPYLLFVTFFPHLIAGPLVHHGEMMPQFTKRSSFRINYADIAIGLTIFFIGLFKKVIIADQVAIYASSAFAGAAKGYTFTFFEGWTAALSYTMQLYFDFSGYSDMAIGLARLFGILLPLNFNSPYRAFNIIDFWRRWHMTLSRFLRDYLYIPLGGGRKGPFRRHANLLITMLLGGLWHGAGWTFIIWGFLHGCFLIINHVWRGWRKSPASLLEKGGGWALTFLAVVVGWVFFRAASFDAAMQILRGMFGFNGISLPEALSAKLHSLSSFTKGWISFEGIQVNAFPQGVSAAAWALAAMLIALLLPNVYQIMNRFQPAFETYPGELRNLTSSWLLWRPRAAWAVLTALLGIWSILNLSRVSEFLYFQF